MALEFEGLNTGRAIILVSVIVVFSFWGITLAYEFFQEQHVKTAPGEELSELQQAFDQEGLQEGQDQAEFPSWEEKFRAKQFAEEQARSQAERSREERERRLQSVECQFWLQQHNLKTTERIARKKAEWCGE